jgi:hypothetical protein
MLGMHIHWHVKGSVKSVAVRDHFTLHRISRHNLKVSTTTRVSHPFWTLDFFGSEKSPVSYALQALPSPLAHLYWAYYSMYRKSVTGKQFAGPWWLQWNYNIFKKRLVRTDRKASSSGKKLLQVTRHQYKHCAVLIYRDVRIGMRPMLAREKQRYEWKSLNQTQEVCVTAVDMHLGWPMTRTIYTWTNVKLRRTQKTCEIKTQHQ